MSLTMPGGNTQKGNRGPELSVNDTVRDSAPPLGAEPTRQQKDGGLNGSQMGGSGV
jgi:hypothetical protein